MNRVREFILDRLQREYSFKDGTDIDAINFVDEGYMDSLGLLQFIGETEDEFGIEFTDEELESGSFRIVGELIAMVEKKLEAAE
jgi:acyl carrier protein